MKKTFVLLILSLIFIIGCSSKSDKDYFEQAQKSMDAKEFETALTDFQKIVDEFPNSEHYKIALLQTGELNHGLVNKEITKEDSYAKAIKAYGEYQKKYSDDEKAPQTLFMIGFIQANELGKLDDAKATYTKFVELYPESDMAESAKSEIQNMGLSPDQILQKQVVK
ncbi:MAG: tetratricopeptide repeat protein [Melioribacteraceae bacterium]|jgi:TolA-binding protein|nr:tetratricopeptide repeat protein [Melioribacteraceae bacterium]